MATDSTYGPGVNGFRRWAVWSLCPRETSQKGVPGQGDQLSSIILKETAGRRG